MLAMCRIYNLTLTIIPTDTVVEPMNIFPSGNGRAVLMYDGEHFDYLALDGKDYPKCVTEVKRLPTGPLRGGGVSKQCLSTACSTAGTVTRRCPSVAFTSSVARSTRSTPRTTRDIGTVYEVL